MRASRAAAAVLAAVLALSGCGTGDERVTREPGSGVMPYGPGTDVPASRARIEEGQAAVRAVLDDELGPSDWHVDRPAQQVACPPRTAVPTPGKFYPVEYSRPEVLDHAAWRRVWPRVVQAVAPLGFRPEAADRDGRVERAQSGARFGYLVDRHGDSLTVSTAPGVGTGYGGFGACHPW